METFSNIQTVATFGMEDKFLECYEQAMEEPLRLVITAYCEAAPFCSLQVIFVIQKV